MIKVGQKVKFKPFDGLKGYCASLNNDPVIGVVDFVNEEHRWFSVVYGPNNTKNCFKFDDIGDSVRLVKG